MVVQICAFWSFRELPGNRSESSTNVRYCTHFSLSHCLLHVHPTDLGLSAQIYLGPSLQRLDAASTVGVYSFTGLVDTQESANVFSSMRTIIRMKCWPPALGEANPSDTTGLISRKSRTRTGQKGLLLTARC